MKYDVLIEPFAERHYIRTFKKKYKNAWDLTLASVVVEFEQIEILLLRKIAEYITDKSADVVMCKTEFKISGTKMSRHGSGNRCIVAIHQNTNQVKILLVYHKTDLGGGSETGNWKRIVKNNYKQYEKLL